MYKLYSLARFDQYGKPYEFFNFTSWTWQTNQTLNCFTESNNGLDKLAEKEKGFALTYKVEREYEKVMRPSAR